VSVKPRTIAVQGVKGGVGTTTVSAHLAAALSALDNQVYVFDFCRQNSLGLYLGLSFNETRGLAVQVAKNLPWQDSAFESFSGIRFFPFGAAFDIDLNARLGEFLESNDQWFSKALDLLQKQYSDTKPIYCIIDTPRYPNNIANTAIANADLVLDVLLPDAASYACMIKRHAYDMECGVTEQYNTQRRYLLNGYSPTLELERDICDLLQTEVGEIILPVAIHKDEHVKEAVAQKQNAFEGALASQAHRDFKLLATWTLSYFGATSSSIKMTSISRS
jgi:cellulose synthase operon protein YhjQ